MPQPTLDAGAPDPARPHPDPTIETMLRILRRTTQALARMGAQAHARESFRQALDVGTRLGPPAVYPTQGDAA